MIATILLIVLLLQTLAVFLLVRSQLRDFENRLANRIAAMDVFAPRPLTPPCTCEHRLAECVCYARRSNRVTS